MIFQNVDGNRTNFDSFNLELDRISEKLHVIGLAETNVGAEESTVYNIEGYNCFYQDKHVNKSKGSGVALYLIESLNGVVNDELSWVSKNLETLFITTRKPVTGFSRWSRDILHRIKMKSYMNFHNLFHGIENFT